MCTKRRVDFPLLVEWVDLDCKQITIIRVSSKETQDEREPHFISSTVNNLYFVDRKSFQFSIRKQILSETFRIPWFWKLCKQDSLAIKKKIVFKLQKFKFNVSRTHYHSWKIFWFFSAWTFLLKRKRKAILSTFMFYFRFVSKHAEGAFTFDIICTNSLLFWLA